jgi:hypothetical protein
MSIRAEFENWGLGYSGCDGGDMGDTEARSTWVCGIEWGGGHDPETLRSHMREDVSKPPIGYQTWKENISYIFNWQVMKLLAAIEGGKVEDYKAFAERVQPFVQGKIGYFKMNLYPIGFKDTNGDRWRTEFSGITGFNSKPEYITWCKEQRLPKIRTWASRWRPQLILCLGKTYIDDFSRAFFDQENTFNQESIDDRDLRWGINDDGALVVVLPFMVNRNGLVKNTSIQKVGERISQLQLLTRHSDGQPEAGGRVAAASGSR